MLVLQIAMVPLLHPWLTPSETKEAKQRKKQKKTLLREVPLSIILDAIVKMEKIHHSLYGESIIPITINGEQRLYHNNTIKFHLGCKREFIRSPSSL